MMTFNEFKDEVINEKKPTGITSGAFFMLKLLYFKPNIYKVYRNTALDPTKYNEINPLVWRMTKLIWEEINERKKLF